MSDNDFSERRRYRRVNVSIPVRYREIGSDEIIESSRIFTASECSNLSRGGMQLVTDDCCEKTEDRLFEAEFVLSGKKVKLIARVAWLGFDSLIKKCRMGLEFIAVKSGDLEVIGQIA